MNSVRRIALITVQELFHEKIFYLLGAFACLAMLLSLFLGDLTFTEQTKITLDFLLAGVEITTLLFSIFMGITLINRELNLGWIAMVLSKPITRNQFLLGKFLGQILIQGVVILFLGLLIGALCFLRDISIVPQALLQSLILTFFQGMMLSAIVYLCTVNLGALLAATVSLSLYALGNFTEGAPGINSNGTQVSFLGQTLKALLPNFRLFNMKTLVSYGLQMDWSLVGIASAYALTCTVLYFSLACFTFARRDILT